MTEKIILSIIFSIVILGLIGFSNEAHAILAVDPPVTLEPSSSFSSLAIGTDGYPVISYYYAADGRDLKLIHCTEVNCSEKDDPVILDSIGNVGWYTSLAIGTDGFPVISYNDIISGDLKFVHCKAVDCSDNDTPRTFVGMDHEGTLPSIAIGTDGYPIIAYRDDTNSNLKLVHCKAVDCSENDLPITLDGRTFVGIYKSIAIGTDGFPVISYSRSGGPGGLGFIHCTEVDCSEKDDLVILDSDSVGWYNSLAIGTDGYPIISYFTPGPGFSLKDLKLVHCTEVDCSDNDDPITIDDRASVGRHLSLAIGTDDYPVISYRDDTTDSLELLHCTAVDCSSRDSPITIESGISSWYTSLAIGTDGYPVISYQGGQLQLSHCLSPTCEGDNTNPIVVAPEDISDDASATHGADGGTSIIFDDPTATDNVGVTVGPTCDAISGDKFQVGISTVTCTAKDAAGNEGTDTFDVTITDKTPPVTTLSGNLAVEIIQGTTYDDAGATAQDNVDGDITANIKTVNPVDENTPAIYEISYDVSDSAENTALQVIRSVTVISHSEAVDDLSTIIDATVENPKDAKKLTKKLDKVTSSLNPSEKDLQKLITETNKLLDKGKISPEDHTALVTAIESGDVDTINEAFSGLTSVSDKDLKKLSKPINNLNSNQSPDIGKACNELDGFIKETQKLFSKGKLTQEEAVPLITAANNIKSAIDCP